jgi:hypothetical protein
MMSPNSTIPQLPGGPEAGKPVPRTPVDGVDLATYAVLATRLAAGAEPRPAVLARAGLSEVRWLEVEKTWLLRMATALLQGDLSLQHEHEAATNVAQAERASQAPLLPIEVYAEIVAGIEAGRAPAEVLAGTGITLGEFMHQQRAWTARIAADKALASSFRAMVARYKAARG